MKTILYNINVEKLNNKIFDIIIYNETNNFLFNIIYNCYKFEILL